MTILKNIYEQPWILILFPLAGTLLSFLPGMFAYFENEITIYYLNKNHCFYAHLGNILVINWPLSFILFLIIISFGKIVASIEAEKINLIELIPAYLAVVFYKTVFLYFSSNLKPQKNLEKPRIPFYKCFLFNSASTITFSAVGYAFGVFSVFNFGYLLRFTILK